MQGKVHVAIGTVTAVGLIVAFPKGFEVLNVNMIPLISLATIEAGSYLPDIDMGTTHSGRQHPLVSKAISKLGGGHRGVTHTLVVPIILIILVRAIGLYLGDLHYLASLLGSLIFGFFVGWVSHIFADLFNGKGCPLLWPIMQGKVHIMDLPSDGFVPWVFTGVYTLCEAFLLWRFVF